MTLRQTRQRPYRPARRLPIRLRYLILPAIFAGLVAFVASFMPDSREDKVAPPPAITMAERPAALRELILENPQLVKDLSEIEPAAGDPVAEAAEPIQPASFVPPVRAFTANNVKVGKGDTMMNLLVRNNVSRGEAYEAIESMKKTYDPRDIKAGQVVRVVFSELQGKERRFEGIKLEPDALYSVVVKRDQTGAFESKKKDKIVKREMKAARGTITSSLYVAGSRQDVPTHILVDLIRIYSWSVDFQRDIRSGDQFELMYEEFVTEDGAKTGKGNILYATLRLSGRPYTLYRYAMKDGTYDYFDPAGRSARKALMKTPIDGARLSSGFGMRKHPVLGYNKMHKGLDFAAPTGTPIFAAGDGVIERRGRNGGYGNYIRLRHRHGLQTAYAHLNKFKSGHSVGKRVKQGEVIGYVGTTGRSTGPHLHYEVIINGRQVNPRTINMPTGVTLKEDELDNFIGIMAQANADFEALGIGGVQLASNTKIPLPKPEMTGAGGP